MHDIHFLERLPRANFAETEMALSLYRDAALVRALLDRAAAPEADRIAIALGPGLEPSWLIVARDGGFVTCLGSGMDPGSLPRLTHDTVKGVAARFDELRARFAYWDSCAESGGEMRRLIREIFESGERLSRERMRDLVPLAPLMWPMLYSRIVDLDQASRTIIYDEGERLLRRRDRLSSHDIEQLRCVWDNEWAKGHIAVLLGSCHREIRAFAEARPDLTQDYFESFSLVAGYFGRYGYVPHVIRGIWFAAQFGKSLVRPLKEQLRIEEHEELVTLFGMPILALTAIGMRYDKVRAEITKALATKDVDTRQAMFRKFCSALLVLTPEQRTAIHLERREAGAKAIRRTESSQSWESLSPDERQGLLAEADAIFCNLPSNAWTSGRVLSFVLELMPWFVSLPPEQLQSPAAEMRAPWKPSDTLSFLADIPPLLRTPRAPITAAPKQGRNDPCACGSGKKFKRCCGA